MKRLFGIVSCLIFAFTLAACGGDSGESSSDAGSGGPVSAAQAAERITPERIKEHMRILSSDEYGGRGPQTDGAIKTRHYLVEQLKAAGVQPGNDGAWNQDVPLRRVTNRDQELRVSGLHINRELKKGTEYVSENKRGAGTNAVSGELVFVGHGIQAPEYGWDDYKGIDCRNKILVMLVGDPPTADEKLFGGKAMTYYGRWTYKFEKAEEMGALGCLVVHHRDWAGYGWLVVRNSWSGQHMNVQEADPDEHLALEGWVQWHIAEELVKGTGKTLDQLAAEAATRDFKPVALGVEAFSSIQTDSTDVNDANVVGVIPGSDPELADEWVIYTAHWDHLGTQNVGEGKDGIYNGAVDNASGCAALLNIAEAMAAMNPRPKRSTMFLFVCSEEQGLLGSKYYAQNPIVPVNKTLANVNIDGLNVFEASTDVQVIGYGQSSLDAVLARQLHPAGRYTAPDSESEKGYYYRSDHFNFARVGIPAIFIKPGDKVPGKPSGYLRGLQDKWRKESYHQPSDEFDPAWPVTGGAADAQVLFHLGIDVLNGTEWPTWSETSEFRARREKSLGQ